MMKKKILNIACLQTRPKPDFQSALDEALGLAEKAVKAGSEFICLPEYCGGLKTEGSAFSPPLAQENVHPVLQGLKDFASTHKVFMLIGSIAIGESSDNKFWNRGFILDDRGEILSRYDKIHLFDINLSEKKIFRESTSVNGGKHASICQTPHGIVGHTICYDLRFPDLYRQLAKFGAEILFVPAAFTKKTGEAHWHVLNRARAIENGSFVVAPCAIGKVDGGGESYGHSLIVDPWGKILADGGEDSCFIQASINLYEVQIARNRIPSLIHDQPFELLKSEEFD